MDFWDGEGAINQEGKVQRSDKDRSGRKSTNLGSDGMEITDQNTQPFASIFSMAIE